MTSFLLQLLILTFLFVSGTLCVEQQLVSVPKNQVDLISDVPDIPEPLKVCCISKSNDIDIGNHTLKKGQELNWTFGASASGSALYSCHFYWQSKDKSFNVYDGSVRQYCGLSTDNACICYWCAEPDGFYISGDKSEWRKLHSWSDS
ncbi:hypothetical protein RHSIM_Rhsim04G0228300 [Rhododendron simsii]|uniref:S-protein homolog n=1 Tax=Rhododendron simsii TaxID=118357 RepID=A0A834H4A2_RHOSS|nr:hypothetical protein RHSIM_Rhsim04G0228300 [Rhododendron simsii]